MTVLRGKEMGDFSVQISQRLKEEALKILASGKLERAVMIPSSGGEVNAMLSPRATDLIPLQEIEYEGVTYYLGIPREESGREQQ